MKNSAFIAPFFVAIGRRAEVSASGRRKETTQRGHSLAHPRLAPERFDGPSVGEPMRPAELIGDFAGGLDAQAVEESGGEIGGGDGAVGGFSGMTIGGAVDLAAANAAAGKGDGEDATPVIASGLRVD